MTNAPDSSCYNAKSAGGEPVCANSTYQSILEEK